MENCVLKVIETKLTSEYNASLQYYGVGLSKETLVKIL